MNEKYTENKGCAGLRSNPAHPLFSGFFHRQCVSHNNRGVMNANLHSAVG